MVISPGDDEGSGAAGSPGIEPDDLAAALRVLEQLPDLPAGHPDIETVKRASQRMFNRVRKARRAAARQEREAPLRAAADEVLAAMFEAGAGEVGDYSECAWRVDGVGQFRPGDDANPAIGSARELTTLDETRIELVAARGHRERVARALRDAHPYEEPAHDIVELAGGEREWGLGRVGVLPESMSLAAFTVHVATALGAPARAAGDPDALIRTVAVCGGAGDSLLGAVARLGVDAYVTGDLRHHPVDEHLRAGGPAVVDAGHWGTEFPWCATVAELLWPYLDVAVHDAPTDPFTVRSAPTADA